MSSVSSKSQWLDASPVGLSLWGWCPVGGYTGTLVQVNFRAQIMCPRPATAHRNEYSDTVIHSDAGTRSCDPTLSFLDSCRTRSRRWRRRHKLDPNSTSPRLYGNPAMCVTNTHTPPVGTVQQRGAVTVWVGRKSTTLRCCFFTQNT